MAVDIKIYNPGTLSPPLGQYSHITRVRGATETLYIAGLVGVDQAGNILEGFEAQTGQVFANISTALRSAEMDWSHVVQFTTYLVHSQDLPKFMSWRLKNFPKLFPSNAYPPNTLLMIDRLVNEALLIEVQTTAVR